MVTGTADIETTAVEAAELQGGVGRDVILTFGGRLALTAAIIVGDVILARTLGPEGKGAFTLVLALSGLGAVILSLGFERSLGVFVARSTDVARRAVANAGWWALIVGALGALLILALYGAPGSGGEPTGPLAPVLPALSQTGLVLAAVALPLEMAYSMGILGLLGRQRLVPFNVVRFMRRGLLTALIVAVALVGRLDLTSLLGLNLLTMAVTVGVISWSLARAGVMGYVPSGPLLVQQLSFGLRTFVGTVAERLHFRVDAFLLTAFISVASTGVYSVALGLSEMLWYLPSAFGLVLFSRAVTREASTASIASSMTRTVLAIVVLVAIPLWIVAPTLIEVVYGAPFRDAGFALQLMLPGIVAYSLVAVLQQFLVAWGIPGRVTAVLVGGLVLNLVANSVLIPKFAIMGAAMSASISYTATALGILFLFHSISGRTYRETLLVRRTDLKRISAAITQLLGRSGQF